jgi:hypothetical protein
MLVGAHEETHNLTINGHKWLHQPGTPQDPLAVNNSGYRNSQIAGISEHFEFLTGKESIIGNRPFVDYLYQNNASVDGQWNGVWGLFRVYNGRAGFQTDLAVLPNNTEGLPQWHNRLQGHQRHVDDNGYQDVYRHEVLVAGYGVAYA